MPRDFAMIKKSVADYEKYLDSLLIDIKRDYDKKINNGKNLGSVSNEIFKKLNLIRL